MKVCVEVDFLADGANYLIDALEVHDEMYKLRSIFADPKIVKVSGAPVAGKQTWALVYMLMTCKGV